MIEQPIWQFWKDSLRRLGMDRIVAEVLKVSGPLTMFAAQTVYLGQPFLRGLIAESHLSAMAELFEDEDLKQAFISKLLEDTSA